jgi:hypothetical protein
MPKITLVENYQGRFVKAFFNETQITESEFNKIIDMEKRPEGFRISKYLEDFKKENPEYIIDVFEK